MRSIAVLHALAEEPEGLSVRRLAELTGASRSAVHRLLQSLADERYAVQTASGTYRPGPRLYELATQVLSSSTFLDVADALMRELVDETKETVYVSVLAEDHRSGIHLHRVDSPEPLRYLLPRGSRFPLHAGAAGKSMLAFLGPPWPLSDLKSLTPDTVTDAAVLEEQLLRIRADGFAVTMQERVVGAAGVSAPLLVDGEVVGSLTLSIPVARIADAGLAPYGPLVRDYADRLTIAMTVLGRSEFSGL